MENMTENSTGIGMENLTDYTYMVYDYYSLDLSEPYNTIMLVLTWLVPFMVIASVTGNVLIIAVMCMSTNRSASTSVYFLTLAISDMFLMVFFSLDRWLFSVNGIHTTGTNQTTGRFRIVAENACVQISCWVLSLITVERVVCMVIPHRFKQICTVRLASTVVAVTCVASIVSQIIYVSVMIDAVYTGGVFLYKDRFEGGLAIYSALDLVFGFSIPFFIIFVGTIIIAAKLFRMKGKEIKSSRKSILQTLVAVNLVFLVTMSPFRVLYIFYPDAIPTDISWDLFAVYHETVIILVDVNSTLNFYIYVLSGQRFRADLKRLLCGCVGEVVSGTNAGRMSKMKSSIPQ